MQSVATIEFKKNGELIYSIIENDAVKRSFLKYEVKENVLITDQPSNPGIETTAYKLSNDILELSFSGIKSTFIKMD